MSARIIRSASAKKMSSSLALVLGVATVACLAFTLGCPAVQPPAGDGDGDGTGDSGVTGDYIGATTCALCHSQLHDGWLATKHAKSLESLEAIGQDTNTLCLGCHTVGFGKAGGFVNRATTNSLAGVQCESCHGAGRDHRENVADRSLRPPVDISSDVCSQCHNPFHHTLFAEWQASTHSTVTESAAEDFAAGVLLNVCGTCHSGDYRQAALIEGETVSDSFLSGKTADEMNAVVCATCHDPHRRTNKAFLPDGDHDIQLRYAEVSPLPAPTNSIADVQDPDRFNLCGQCHHSRGRVWTSTSRGPHHSVQSNYYVGEMPVPDGTDLLVANQRTAHAFVPKQCVSCHMQREAEADGIAVFHSNHGFAVEDFAGCSATGCHPSPESAQADLTALQTETQAALDAIAARLGDPSTWEYSATGGPAADAQAALPDEIKKVRFMYSYLLGDGSLGVHNPEYTRDILAEMDTLLTDIGR